MSTTDFVLCKSADGWSLHVPGSTDEDIASGDAPYLVSGVGKPTHADYAAALAKLDQPRGSWCDTFDRRGWPVRVWIPE